MPKFWKVCVIIVILQAVFVKSNLLQSSLGDDTFYIDQDTKEVDVRSATQLDTNTLLADELQPIDNVNENDGWLLNSVHRVRRGLRRFFGLNAEKEFSKSALKATHKKVKLNSKEHKNSHLFKILDTKKSKRQSQNNEEYEASGADEVDEPAEFWQAQFIVTEPWHESYRNQSSEHFQSLAKTLQGEIHEVYQTQNNDDEEYNIKVWLLNVLQTHDYYKVYVVVRMQLPAHVSNFGDYLLNHINTYSKLISLGAEVDGEYYFRNVREIESDTTTIQTTTNWYGAGYDAEETFENEVAVTNCDTNPDGEFVCQNGEVISCHAVCDNVVDCNDGEDEGKCEINNNNNSDNVNGICRKGQYECTSGESIPCSRLCDRNQDCASGSDEWPDVCPEVNTDETSVLNTNFVNPVTSKVDEGNNDIEASGEPSSVSCNQFACNDGRTLVCEEKVCNGVQDCPNNDDEEMCVVANTTNGNVCSEGEYSCNNQCIPNEQFCPPMQEVCQSDEYRCQSGECINRSKHCDYVRDCPDGDDEEDCRDCSSDEFFCDNSCHPKSIRCNGERDCWDNTDEQNCAPSTRPPIKYPCPEFTCPNGRCYSSRERCDGKRDCDDGTDELNCCTNNQFRCSNGECVPGNAQCNGYRECRDGSDEEECETSTGCTASQFRCDNGQCINIMARCDGRTDCYDSSDEYDCTNKSPINPQLLLKTYPDNQTIKQSNEVIFRCRDEGPLRAKVRWSRPDGSPLPAGAKDYNGRLEIPNIRMEDSGTYICEAVGYPRHIPGQQVSVTLNVERYYPSRPPSACHPTQATCMNGECIDKTQICDGISHCSDGSDEHSCSRGRKCHPNQFMCKNSKCVERIWRCDGENDCGDNSDEESCDSQPSDVPCRYNEFQCRNGPCIPKSFQCDDTSDCLDNSDEVGCMAPVPIRPPPPRQIVSQGDALNLTCVATGVPTPEVGWRLNWGFVPEKCIAKTHAGTGTLYCPNMELADSGAYSCEIINSKGTVFVTPDTLVTIDTHQKSNVCPSGFFNMLARYREDCISCFCFGITKNCQSADLYTYSIQPPITSKRVANVELKPFSNIIINEAIQPNIIIWQHGVQFRASNILYSNKEEPYLALPDEYMGNQLKSYGGYLRYKVNFIGTGRPTQSPDVILTGNGYTLVYRTRMTLQANTDNQITVQFIPGQWNKPDGRLATREELMMVLANVENILIRLSYINATEREVELTHIAMDSAGLQDQGLGSASLVEHCMCPPGYAGDSCESCAPGFVRQNGGAWLGRCVPMLTEICPHGTYGDPRRGIPCRECPCPQTGANNYANGCEMGPDGEVNCNCKEGYAGRRCESCAAGYEGNPFIEGIGCNLIPEITCNAEGTYYPYPNGTCECKSLVTGPRCDQCAPESFFLNSFTYTGCIECFCSGLTKQCTSSSWYRDQVSSSTFGHSRAPHGFDLIYDYDSSTPTSVPIKQGENSLQFSQPSISEPLYWSLPPQYLGNKITAYGGKLSYSLSYNPLPGGLMSRNNAPDVVIKSAEGLSIIHYRKSGVNPNQSSPYGVPIIESAWQRVDGQPVNREQLLMALSKIEAIFIKATYTTSTKDGTLTQVSLDIATPNNIGTTRAVEVEECRCPPGYVGLSCERCANGYKPSVNSQLYGPVCEPCSCNNHADQCDPETGICIACDHNTEGDNCERCAAGFVGNASGGTPYDCRPATDYYPTPPKPDTSYNQTYCSYCNQDGTISCDNGYCQCKSNAYGTLCDQCRPGTYDLSANNPDGCRECYCSGKSQNCRSSNLYRQEIPVDFFLNITYITDEDGNILVYPDKLKFNATDNSLEYRNMSYDSIYWSIRGALLGNQLMSYGGKLSFNLHVDSNPYGRFEAGNDIVLIGNGMKLLWSRPENNQDERYYVSLDENANWQRLDRGYAVSPASRQDIMSVLSKLEHLLIRASTKRPTARTVIQDVILESAIEHPTSAEHIATEIEICNCPSGYIGNSCENCASLHYRDVNNNCQVCPCQEETTQTCNLDASGYVECHCISGYSGDRCQNDDSYPLPVEPTTPVPDYDYKTRITVSIAQPKITIIPVGGSLVLTCTGRLVWNNIPVLVNWYKQNGHLPRNYYMDGGELRLYDLQIYDSGTYICQAVNNQTSAVFEDKVSITITENSQRTPSQIINLPDDVEFEEYQPNEINCEVSGNPTPRVIWTRVDGQMSNDVRTEGTRLIFNSPRVTDNGSYRCIATNEVGDDQRYTRITVRPATVGPLPPPREYVYIDPPGYSGEVGNDVQLTCNPTAAVPLIYEWSKDGYPIYRERHIIINGNILEIRQPTVRDSGVYTCTGIDQISRQNYTDNVPVNIVDSGMYNPQPTPHPGAIAPTVQNLPSETLIVQGRDQNITCEATGSPQPKIRWTKIHEALADNVYPYDNVLQIKNARMENRGMYVCIAENSAGTGQQSTFIEIDAREHPTVEIQPSEPQVLHAGYEAALYCRALGIPEPRVQWRRVDGQELSSSAKELAPGYIIIENVQVSDAAEYECIAENELGQAKATTSVRVIEAPVISIDPSDEVLRYHEGDNVKITCTATGTPPPTVQWIADDSEPVVRTMSLQFNQATLELYRVSRLDSKSWKCIASNEAGTVDKWSTLDIKPWDSNRGDAPDDGEYNPEPERSDSNRADVPEESEYNPEPERYPQPKLPENIFRANVGEESKLTCGLDENTYWERVDGRPLGAEVHTDGKTLLIPRVDEQHAGRYRCRAFDSNNNYRGEYIVELQVIPIPHITLHPKMPLVVMPNENVEIYCQVTGEQPIQVSWHAHNNRSVSPSVQFEGQYLRFYAITPADAGHYICTAKNRYGIATEIAEVQVNRGASSLEQPETRRYNIRSGEDVQLTCDTSHARDLIRGPVVYTWRRADGRPLPPHAYIDNHVLHLRGVMPDDHGTYVCEAASYGRTFAPSFAELNIIPSIPQQQREYYLTTTQRPRDPVLKLDQQHSKLHAGESTEVECYASDGSYSDIVWERSDGTPLPPNLQQVENRLVINAAKPSDAGQYICKCRTDTGHLFTTKFQLEIDANKLDLKQPKIVHVNVGDDVNLPCEHSLPNAISLDYKWTRQYGQIQPNQDVYSPELKLNAVQAHDSGSYICTVTTNDGERHESLTTLVVTGAIPQFNQDPLSYMIFPKLSDSDVRFNFDISFRPERSNGILLFNGQNHGSGDFIALSLSNGYPEFRYDFDGKPMIIRAEKPISMNEWHTIHVNRFRRDGYMQVDDQHPVALPTISQIARLDLVDDLYIGGVPSWDILPPNSVEYQEGFTGCISRLTLQSTTIELMKEAKFKVGITSCEPCAENLCQHDGVCIESQSEMAYTCTCQPGWTGRNCAIPGTQCAPGICGTGRCENTDFGMECLCPLNRTGDRCQYVEHLKDHSIAFRSNGYAAYDSPRASKLNIKFQVRPNSIDDSVILYTSESKLPSGDYVAVLLHNKHIELVINTGARLNPVIVRSLNPLPINKWTEIEISRKFGESILRVGNEPELKGKANGLGRQLYIKTPLYIGGYDYQNVKLNHDINITKGFDGCIANLNESKRQIKLITHIIDAANILNCGETNEIDENFSPSQSEHSQPGKEVNSVSCAIDPCENNGTCFMENEEVYCNCVIGFTGKYCEEHITLEYSAKFQGNGYLELNRNQFSEAIDQKYTFAAMVFSTTQPDGLLLWWGQNKSEEYNGQDFIALAVVDGIIEYAFRLNGEETIIRNPDNRVDDGARHLVIIKRTDNTGVLEIDHLLDAGETRPTGTYTMHLPGHVFIGGAPDIDKLTGGRHRKNFIGCVHVVEGDGMHIIKVKDAAVSGINIDTCPDIEEDIGTEPPVV